MARTLSLEHRAAISRAQLGKKRPGAGPHVFTLAHRLALSAAFKGRTFSPESRSRMRAAHLGIPLSTTQRAAISDGLRLWHARRRDEQQRREAC